MTLRIRPSHRRRPRTRGEAGFAIVEVVVAAAIVAGMMALTYRTIVGNAQAGRMVAERRNAAMLAQSVLAQATASPDAASLVQTGRDGALTWQVARSAYDNGGTAPLERVAVRVSGPNGPLITLDTLRLAR